MVYRARGLKPQWQVIYEHVRGMASGELVTRQELVDLLTDSAPGSMAPALGRAVKELQERDHLTLVNVRGVGYRLGEPSEHLEQAKGHTRRARRNAQAAVRTVAAADRTRMTADERRAVDAFEHHMRSVTLMLERGTRQRAENLTGQLPPVVVRSAPEAPVALAVSAGDEAARERLRAMGMLKP